MATAPTANTCDRLTRKDQVRLKLRNLLRAGAVSTPATPADADHFQGLRERLHPETSYPNCLRVNCNEM